MMTPGLGATRIRMRSLTGRLVRLAFAAGIVSLCASGIAAARDPAAPYLGMTKAQILACVGEPYSRFKSGAAKERLPITILAPARCGAGPRAECRREKIRGKGIEEHLQQIQEERGQELDLLGKPRLRERQAREGDLRA